MSSAITPHPEGSRSIFLIPNGLSMSKNLKKTNARIRLTIPFGMNNREIIKPATSSITTLLLSIPQAFSTLMNSTRQLRNDKNRYNSRVSDLKGKKIIKKTMTPAATELLLWAGILCQTLSLLLYENTLKNVHQFLVVIQSQMSNQIFTHDMPQSILKFH